MPDLKMIIDGKEVESHSKQRMKVINPATEKEIGSVPKGTVEDVELLSAPDWLTLIPSLERGTPRSAGKSPSTTVRFAVV